MAIRNKQDELAFFRGKCKEHGMRVTHQKTMIYMALLDSLDHPSPEQVFNKLKHTVHGLSLDTVYRTLSAFNKMGLIDLVEGYGTARRFDPKLEKHHHFQCRKCSTTYCMEEIPVQEYELPEGFKMLENQLLILGICKNCLYEME